MIDKQQKFFECQECSSIVERVYQNGVCRACLNKKLQSVRIVIDRHHALSNARHSSAGAPRTSAS